MTRITGIAFLLMVRVEISLHFGKYKGHSGGTIWDPKAVPFREVYSPTEKVIWDPFSSFFRYCEYCLQHRFARVIWGDTGLYGESSEGPITCVSCVTSFFYFNRFLGRIWRVLNMVPTHHDRHHRTHDRHTALGVVLLVLLMHQEHQEHPTSKHDRCVRKNVRE